MKKRVVIVDDHASIRGMLAWLLGNDPFYQVVGQAGSGIAGVRECKEKAPDLLILDLILPCLSGVEVLRRVRIEAPDTRVLLYSGTRNWGLVREALWLNPHGYVEKLEDLCVLRGAILKVATGGSYYSEDAARILTEVAGQRLSGMPQCNLTEREREILGLIAEGRTSKQISSTLNVALKTVENHRANMMSKLGRHDIASLTRYAAAQGFVTVD